MLLCKKEYRNLRGNKVSDR